jgi:cilia- and flagella-associated protein 44
VAVAEAKKVNLRDLLDHIRNDFEALLAENEAQPEAERLPKSEFEIDPGLRELMEAEVSLVGSRWH